MAAVALLVLPLSHLLIPGEKMTLRRSIGFGIGFVGVLVLIGSKALDMTGADLEWARTHRLLWRRQLLCDKFGCDAALGANGSHRLGGCKLADWQWLCGYYSLCHRGAAACNKQHWMGFIDFF